MPKKRKSSSSSESSPIENKLLDNLVQLQKVHIDMAEKFDKLAREISSLLGLFELAAKNFSVHPATKVTENDKEFLDKIDKLLEQNKTIAKGLTLMEDQMRQKLYHKAEKKEESNQTVGQEYQASQNSTISSEYSPSIKSNRAMPRF